VSELGPRDRPALAPNWRTVLAVDALLGVAAVVVGVLAGAGWSPLLGVVLVLAGLAYLAVGLRRARRWAGIRRAAGL
jgi:hypothetical protein